MTNASWPRVPDAKSVLSARPPFLSRLDRCSVFGTSLQFVPCLVKTKVHEQSSQKDVLFDFLACAIGSRSLSEKVGD